SIFAPDQHGRRSLRFGDHPFHLKRVLDTLEFHLDLTERRRPQPYGAHLAPISDCQFPANIRPKYVEVHDQMQWLWREPGETPSPPLLIAPSSPLLPHPKTPDPPYEKKEPRPAGGDPPPTRCPPF